MKRIRLLRTTAFRLSLLYAGVYSLLAAAGLGFIYWSTASYIETQIDVRLRLETEVLLNLYQDRALPALIETIRQRSRDDGTRRIFFYRLLSPTTDRAGDNLDDLPPAPGTRRYATLRLAEVFGSTATDSPRVRVLATVLPNGQRLLVGRDLNDEQQLLEHTLGVVLGVSAVIFLLALAGSAYLGYLSLRRIDAIDRTAGEIMAGDFSRRIPVTARDDEFDLLGRKLNAMLARIEQLLAGMRQVTDNIAHDLRSPLNRLRNKLDVTLLEARSDDEYRAVLTSAGDDVDGLLKTFNALLNIAQAEAGVSRHEGEPVDLRALTEDLADLYGALAEEQGSELHWQATPGLFVRGNRYLLAQAVGNLLDNAVKYTPPGGRIDLSVAADPGGVVLTVADNGPGIPAVERARVLERFVRLDNARSQPGNGLGLSLVKAVAQLHGARLELADNGPGLRVLLHFAPVRLQAADKLL